MLVCLRNVVSPLSKERLILFSNLTTSLITSLASSCCLRLSLKIVLVRKSLNHAFEVSHIELLLNITPLISSLGSFLVSPS